jgi:S-formylglutathione hydrolase FrmB
MNKLVRLANSALCLAGLFVALALPSYATPRAECRSMPSKILARPVRYCVFLPPSYDVDKATKFPVLYFLHGLGENEQVLLNSGGWDLIQDLWMQKQIGEFLIVAPDGDRAFYINSQNGRVRYEDFFMRELIPFIESRYRSRTERQERGITGISMGGYGALRLALRHPQKFGSVSAHSAVLVAKLPKETPDNPQENAVARLMGAAFGVPFNQAFWDRDNPFTLVREGPRPAGLRIYFDCGTDDEFGFNIGAQAFHQLLESLKIPHEFHLYPGGHSWIYFAEHFPASLKFQSDGFAARASAK